MLIARSSLLSNKNTIDQSGRVFIILSEMAASKLKALATYKFWFFILKKRLSIKVGGAYWPRRLLILFRSRSINSRGD